MIIPKRAIIVKIKGRWHKIKIEVYERDDYVCQIPECPCEGEPLTEDQLTVHHVIPKGRLRLDVPWNLITICHYCHHLLTIDKLPETTIQSLIEAKNLQGWNKINGTT